MNLAAVVNPEVGVRYFDNPLILDNTGEQWQITLTPGDSTKRVRLMLDWTDAPGHGLGACVSGCTGALCCTQGNNSMPAWNNNLDLTVQVGANTYRGNNFGPTGWSQPGGTADGKNNTEGVFLAPIGAVSMTVRVIGADINWDGVTNQGDTTDQDFALVCYNCAGSALPCCLSDGECVEVTAACCQSVGGYLKAGLNCASPPQCYPWLGPGGP